MAAEVQDGIFTEGDGLSGDVDGFMVMFESGALARVWNKQHAEALAVLRDVHELLVPPPTRPLSRGASLD